MAAGWLGAVGLQTPARRSEPDTIGRVGAADPHKLFAHAEAFRRASELLAPGPRATPARLAPDIANGVLALELYLKCLLMLSKGKYPHVHSILALFHDLPSDEISRLRGLHREVFRAFHPAPPTPRGAHETGVAPGPSDARASDHGPPGTSDNATTKAADRAAGSATTNAQADAALDRILAGAKDAFQIARYMYEEVHAGPGGIPDVSVVTDVVRGRILQLAPELAHSGAAGSDH